MGKGARENGSACVRERSCYRAAMRPSLVLALVFALTGCVSAPRGPHAELRDGITPISPPVPSSATYLLHTSGTTFAERPVGRGERLGFVREKDGSVSAVAPGFTLPLAPGSYAWDVIPGTTTKEPSRARLRLAHIGDSASKLAFVLLLLAGTAAHAVAASNSHR